MIPFLKRSGYLDGGTLFSGAQLRATRGKLQEGTPLGSKSVCRMLIARSSGNSAYQTPTHNRQVLELAQRFERRP
jgi:hypothetical protein